MKRNLWIVVAVGLALTLSLLTVMSVAANPPAPSDPTSQGPLPQGELGKSPAPVKPIDQPNPKDVQRIRERQRLLEAGQTAQAAALAQAGSDRVLVLLVEFTGTDVFTWTAGVSHWDPIGKADQSENTGTLGDCSKIITQTKTFTYTGLLHNGIERPRSAADASGDTIWTPDFNKNWFESFMFGNGVDIDYTRQDGSKVFESFTGKSVKDFYSDLSNGQYQINGDVFGWLPLKHSTWYYDADECPGARSTTARPQRGGMIPGAGDSRTLVKDALDALNAISPTIPGFDWHNYDKNGDGVIDRLWIVHAGYGEEDNTTLTNRNPVEGKGGFYGEAAVWSHSSSVTPAYKVAPDVAAGPYIIMPENGGIGVFAHEYGHNLGAADLYSYSDGETSAGFWTTMADDWTGYPLGFEPPAMDPLHLDEWGWLNPLVITDPTKVYTATIAQASRFNDNTAIGTAYRGIKIELPTGQAPLAAPVWQGSHYWWGGKADLSNGKMTTKQAIDIPAQGTISSASLSFDIAYNIEEQWDFLWVQVSRDNGATWDTLTNADTVCDHDGGWIGGEYDMEGKCGLTGANASFPAPKTETFDLSAYAGESVLLRLWYMTDWGTTMDGPFVDSVKVETSNGTTTSTLFSDDAEAGSAKWDYVAPWVFSDGVKTFTHSYYVQWRNTNENGGYDSALGDARYRYGPVNTGMLVWYNNNNYTDNELPYYMYDYPGFGPKGMMLLVDAHPQPYREPYAINHGYNSEAANLTSRSSMRDAPFTLRATVDFTPTSGFSYAPGPFTTHFAGRPAVSEFSDSASYYPGSEYVNLGPAYNPPVYRWMTKQWDSSLVLPSKVFYGVRAPAYHSPGAWRWGCSWSAAGQASCYGVPGLGYDGTFGTPGNVHGDYGWHIRILEEAPDHSWAKVQIWNAPQTYTPYYYLPITRK